MNFVNGVRIFVEAFRRARAPELRRYTWLPALSSLVIILLGLALAVSYTADLATYLQQTFGSWPDWIMRIVEPLLYVTATLISAWLFGFLAVFIGAPFHGELSQHIWSDGTVEQPWYKDIVPTMLRELRKLRYSLPRLIVLLIIGFIPVVNVLSPVLWVVFGAWLMAVQFADFAFENRHQAFSETLTTLRSQRSTSIGFGVCVTLAMAIPLLNFLVIPIAVIGGTLLAQTDPRARTLSTT